MRNIIPFTIILALILTSTSSASWGQTGIDRLNADLEWRGLLIGVIHNLVIPDFTKLYSNLTEVILLNPPVEHSLIWKPLIYFIEFLQPFYMLSLLACGFYLMFISGSVKRRKKAKNLFIKLILSMVFVTLSPRIIGFMSKLSGALTGEILEYNPNLNLPLDTFNGLIGLFSHGAFISLDGGYFFLLLAMMLAFGLFAILAFRYLMLITLIVTFPIALFLYFIDATKFLGKGMIEQTVGWMFTQSLSAIVFVSINLGVLLLNLDGDLKLLSGIIASVMLIISPLILPLMVGRRLLWT